MQSKDTFEQENLWEKSYILFSIFLLRFEYNVKSWSKLWYWKLIRFIWK